MAELKTKKTALSVEDFINKIPWSTQPIMNYIKQLQQLILAAETKFKTTNTQN